MRPTGRAAHVWRCAFWHVLLLSTSIRSNGAVAWRVWGGAAKPTPPAADAQPLLQLTPSNYAAVAAKVASPQRQILLTTVDISYHGRSDPARVLGYFRSFAYHLATPPVARLANLLTLSYSPDTCRALVREAGIPCFVDRAAPRDLPGAHAAQPPTFQKYWHALELTRLGCAPPHDRRRHAHLRCKAGGHEEFFCKRASL